MPDHLSPRPMEHAPMNEEMLIRVDSNDRAIGVGGKTQCHRGDGLLHRAFSIFVFNRAGEMLLQRRAAGKMLWPGYWSNACCSHPRAGEDSGAAARRRLREELGVEAALTFLFKFAYQARYRDIGSEHELCWVWAGVAEADAIRADADEIAEWRFCAVGDFEAELRRAPDDFTPWLKLEWPRVRAYHAEQFASESADAR